MVSLEVIFLFSQIQACSIAVQLRIIYRDLFGNLKGDFVKQSKTILLYSFSAALLKKWPSTLVIVGSLIKERFGSQKLLFSIEFMVCETKMGSRIWRKLTAITYKGLFEF